jgi:uncharacterized protein YuzE
VASQIVVHRVDLRIGPWSFDRAVYDDERDVLYLHRGDPATAIQFDASEEGHALRFDEHGKLVGVTVVSARWLLERDGVIQVTVPVPRRERLEGDFAALLSSHTSA